MLHMAEPFLEQNLHPTVIVRGASLQAPLHAARALKPRPLLALLGYVKALEDALKVIDSIAFPIDTDNRARPCSAAVVRWLRPGFL